MRRTFEATRWLSRQLAVLSQSLEGLPAIDVDTTGAAESVEPLAPARIFSSAWMAYLQLLDAEDDLAEVAKDTRRIAEVSPRFARWS